MRYGYAGLRDVWVGFIELEPDDSFSPPARGRGTETSSPWYRLVGAARRRCCRRCCREIYSLTLAHTAGAACCRLFSLNMCVARV